MEFGIKVSILITAICVLSATCYYFYMDKTISGIVDTARYGYDGGYINGSRAVQLCEEYLYMRYNVWPTKRDFYNERCLDIMFKEDPGKWAFWIRELDYYGRDN